MEEEKKICKTCNSYLNLKFLGPQYADIGVCINKSVNNLKPEDENDSCELWESKEKHKEELLRELKKKEKEGKVIDKIYEITFKGPPKKKK